jgi:Tfp pilus assembly protein PilV
MARQLYRRGMTLFELTMALFILTTAIAAILQLVAFSASQRRAADQRRIALAEVANQAERIALLSWDQTAPEALTTWQPSAELAAVLPQAKCQVESLDEAGPPVGRRLRLSVTWTNAAGQEVVPAAVTIWKFAGEGQP